MDTEPLTIAIKQIDDAFTDTPEEVKDFMVSSDYDLILLGIGDALALTDAQREELKYVSYELVIQTMTPEEAAQALVKNDLFSKELATKAIFGIAQEIISRIQTILEEAKASEVEVSPEQAVTPEEAPTPAQMVARINETLSKPAFTVPTKREYGITRSTEPTPTPSDAQKPLIDPYREIPEES